MEQTANECGCQGACGCNATTDERIRMLEITRELLLAKARCAERTIAELKGPGAGAKSK